VSGPREASRLTGSRGVRARLRDLTAALPDALIQISPEQGQFMMVAGLASVDHPSRLNSASSQAFAAQRTLAPGALKAVARSA
jgi:hypothetical protein